MSLTALKTKNCPENERFWIVPENAEAHFSTKPVFCDLIVTENCMLRCKMCRMWQSKDDFAAVKSGAWERFIDSFADFTSGKAQVQFVGGEPLARKGIFDLVRRASGRGLLTTMTTNACLIDERISREIIDSGLSTIVFSLDGIRRQTHDFLRGVDGVYDRVMRAVDLLGNLKRGSLKIHLVTTIMQPNLEESAELAEWAQNNPAVDHLSFQAVMQPFFTPPDERWYQQEAFSFLWPKDISRADFLLDKLTELKNQGYKITNPAAQFGVFKSYFRYPEKFVKVSQCNLGHNSVSVNTSGKIFLCLSLDPIGDINDGGDIAQMWFSEKAYKIRQDIKRCQRNCKLMINCFFQEET